jgi:1-acyl-sn-glycerol-3-phosphate acyltransferase
MTARTRLDELIKRVDSLFNAHSELRPDNIALRSLHADIELFRLDHKSQDFSVELDGLIARLDLIPFSRPKRWWNKIESIYRFSGMVAGFVTFSVLFSIPMLVLKPMDDLLVKMRIIRPHNMISEHMKRFLSDWLARVAGIVYIAQGIDVDFFEKHSVLLTFTHGSNLDAFLLASTCPVRNYALAKKELFCVPFFSWLAFACGGIPVDRNNREKALLALQRMSDTTQSGNICLVIAPEGTRSKSGQLLPFKKGAFHMWEELRIPIVPAVIYGAYDLCPVGKMLVNACLRSCQSISGLITIIHVIFMFYL